MNKEIIKVGRTLAINLDGHGVAPILAKVDTGAYLCAIWASNVHEDDKTLFYTLFGEGSEYYNGQELSTSEYYVTEVENSFGVSESRYVVKLHFRPHKLEQGGEKSMRFSLCNRSMKKYPILIGRNYLRGRCVVDVRMTAVDNIGDDEEDHKNKLDEE